LKSPRFRRKIKLKRRSSLTQEFAKGCIWEPTFLPLFAKAMSREADFLPPAMIYRYILDLGDSIASLIRLQAGASAFSVLRSLFEGSLALHFILDGNKMHRDRATAYYASYLISQQTILLKQDGETNSGKQFKTTVAADEMLKNVKFPQRDTAMDRAKIAQRLSSEQYRPYWERYTEAKKRGKRCEWFSLCSPEITNRRLLARLLKREGEYEILYGYLSSVTHAEDVFSALIRADNVEEPKGIRIRKLRGPEDKFNIVTSLSASYLLQANNLVFGTFLSGDHELTNLIAHWYQDYRDCYLWMTKPRPLE
jgi:hypothetical protein